MNKQTKAPAWSRKLWWSLLFLLIAAASIYTVVSQSRDFSFSSFWEYIRNANPCYMVGAICSMLCFIIFEGLAIRRIAAAFGYHISFRNGFYYSAVDIYFSSITPSATGGQPASAYFMVKDGIRGIVTTVVLLINLMVYTLSLLTIGLVVFITSPGIFFRFSLLSRIIIILGAVVQTVFAVLFYLLIRRETLLYRICDFVLKLLKKMHLIRHYEKKQQKMKAAFDDYVFYSRMFAGQGKTIFRGFLLNLVQRLAQIAVTVFCFLGTGGGLSDAYNIFATQSFATLGANCIPIPGAMGVSDYLMIDGFSQWMDANASTSLELLSRSVSFYICIIICGLATIAKFILSKKKNDIEK